MRGVIILALHIEYSALTTRGSCGMVSLHPTRLALPLDSIKTLKLWTVRASLSVGDVSLIHCKACTTLGLVGLKLAVSLRKRR